MSRLRKSALAILTASIVALVQPPERHSGAAWAAANLIVPDGPQAGELMDFELTPYLIEPLNFSCFDQPENEIAVRKSAQTGFTLFLLASASHMIANYPCDGMVVQPTLGAMSDFNRQKLTRVIEKTSTLTKKVSDQKSRSGEGSTVTSKQFNGGSLTLAVASSTADLRSKTIKWIGLDEIDEYPEDLANQGSPFGMIAARQTAFLVSGEWKRLYVSTPTIKSQSEIDTRFLAGDQRYWHMPCPGCGEDFKFEFDLTNFKFSEEYPHKAYYVTPCCGHCVEGHEKIDLMKKGRWVATASRPGAYPSYHFDALTSPFVPWDHMATDWLAAKDDPTKLKAFFNLMLGLAFEMSGDAPDHERLMERRVPELKRGFIPPKGVVMVGSADVQGNGIYYNIRAFAPDGQNWPVDADFIAGETIDPRAGAFAELSNIIRREWPDSFGGKRRMDMFAIDSGYRSNVVYMFVRQHAANNIVAVKGLDGWHKPAFGVGTAVEINFNNQRIRKGTVLNPVGTWPLKADFYASLRLKGLAGGADADPSNYIHFAGWQDDAYFTQITGEYLAQETFRGRIKNIWKPIPGKENHFLDTEIYLRAIFHYLTDRMSPDDWHVLISERNIPVEIANPDMFAPAPHRKKAPKQAPAEDDTDFSGFESDDSSDGWFS